jgi:hypothetical protein
VAAISVLDQGKIQLEIIAEAAHEKRTKTDNFLVTVGDT